MKIEGPGPAQRAGGVKKKKSVGGDSDSEGGFDKLIGGGGESVQGTATAQSIAKMDVLLAVQEVEDPTERAARRRVKERGENILKELDNIRMNLLNGRVTVGDVISVADAVATHRDKIKDPQLASILDEIDLRAQVELAKMRIVMDRAK